MKAKRFLRGVLMGLCLGILALSVWVAPEVQAAGSVCDDENLSDDLKEAAGCFTNKKVGDVANSVIKMVLGVLGVVAVGVIIYGGVVFVTSHGDPGKVQKGRNVILYGFVGLIIALLAFSIVNFVTGVVPE